MPWGRGSFLLKNRAILELFNFFCQKAEKPQNSENIQFVDI